MTEGRLVVVIGAGGDRDPGKRPLMGAVAERLADTVIITDDNPRSEDPATIRRAIKAAAPGAIEIGDRATAIREAIAMLGDGDILCVAGKGHETGQIIGSKKLEFSDQAVIRGLLAGEVAA
jgi:UDP-N-acetylmuramyl tripeptide synthase